MEKAAAGWRFMVVDDDPQIHSLLDDMLRFWGGEPVGAAVNGREALEKYGRLRPDVVIMDMEMPGMNGYEASQSIVEQSPQAAIILLTGVPEGWSALKALEKGFVRVIIPKPFRSEQLKMAIEGILKGKGLALPVTDQDEAVA
jgi:CheY-like chemotaxis protein